MTLISKCQFVATITIRSKRIALTPQADTVMEVLCSFRVRRLIGEKISGQLATEEM